MNANSLIALKKYLHYSKNHNCVLSIKGQSGKISKIYVDQILEDRLEGRFASTCQPMQYTFRNIVSCFCANKKEQEAFEKEQFLSAFQNAQEVERQLSHYREYYFKTIAATKDKSLKKTDVYNSRVKHYTAMFENVYKDSTGLFANYLLSQSVNIDDTPDSSPILLLHPSNRSQKKAIEQALRNRVSIIEGPPGTGKTTTILSIIANLVVRGKRVAVISKNNSAIQNVEEELNNLNLPPFYLRFGNQKDIMIPLAQNIQNVVRETAAKMELLQQPQAQDETLNALYGQLQSMEEKINRLITIKNQLQENENQLRHLDKREAAFGESLKFSRLRFFQKRPPAVLRREVNRIANALQLLDTQDKISWWNRLTNRFIWQLKTSTFKENGLLLQHQLERLYLMRDMELCAAELKAARLDETQERLNNLYHNEYITASLAALRSYLYAYSMQSQYQNAVQSIAAYDGCNILNSTRNHILQIYPVILTTADSLANNFNNCLEKGKKLDYIIMDEASQCDLISGLPMLCLADRCVIVGDQKQLSAIVETPHQDVPPIDAEHDYFQQTFLSSVQKVWNIQPVLLQEHYRCDYAIINYCNKYYYDEKLIIYTDASPHAMQILAVEQGKYADKTDFSFENEREVKSIEAIASQSLQSSYVITPFKDQGELLRQHFGCSKDVCGTIHTFQGKGEDTVYFSAVLNDLPFCNYHLESDRCMLKKSLINVAVSRAKKRFVLVADKTYLRGRNTEMKNLIEYIETYGACIPDKTVCIFDYLYQQMDAYTQTRNTDNPFEQKLYTLLQDYCQQKPHYYFFAKLPLANLATDKGYLDTHPAIKRFVLHKNTHLDFTLFNRIGNPVLVIELDGKHHKDGEQQKRDEKKNAVLEHMGIPLWRLSSKAALSQDDFFKKLNNLLAI